MIEIIDKEFFSYLKDFIGDAKLILTADHTTACRKKMHTADAVPVLIYPQEKESDKRFTEAEGLKGRRISGRNLLKNNLFAK
jgi:2,3-bisphosphoglycerate-independent phosphoglycerate mutase